MLISNSFAILPLFYKIKYDSLIKSYWLWSKKMFEANSTAFLDFWDFKICLTYLFFKDVYDPDN